MHYSKPILLIALLLLSGCFSITKKQSIDPDAPVVIAGPPKPAYFDLPTLELSNRAIDTLYKGDEKQSLVYINEILRREPESYVANILLDQINSDPNKFVGSNTYAYKVQDDESLYSLAERHLGDLLYFYALAKVSNIPQPDTLQSGELVMIPSDGQLYQRVQTKLRNKTKANNEANNEVAPPVPATSPAPIASTAESSNNSPEDEEQVSSLYNSGKYLEVVAYADQNPGLFIQPSTLTDNLGKSLLSLSKDAQQNNQAFSAKIFISRAQSLNTSASVKNEITSYNNTVKVKSLLQRAQSLKNKGQTEESIQIYQEVLKIEPGNADAKRNLTALKNTQPGS